MYAVDLPNQTEPKSERFYQSQLFILSEHTDGPTLAKSLCQIDAPHSPPLFTRIFKSILNPGYDRTIPFRFIPDTILLLPLWIFGQIKLEETQNQNTDRDCLAKSWAKLNKRTGKQILKRSRIQTLGMKWNHFVFSLCVSCTQINNSRQRQPRLLLLYCLIHCQCYYKLKL